MTVTVKEVDGAREVEIEHRNGEVWFEGNGFCYKFDRAILLRAVEREFGVVLCAVKLGLEGQQKEIAV